MNIMDHIKGGLIVSCQALENEPLYGGDTMVKMAVAAKNGGAVAIRTNGGNNIREIKDATGLPIIGLVKKEYDGYEAYISPSIKEIDEVCKAGAEVVAIDATKHSRPVSLDKLINYTRSNYPNVKILADISTIEEAVEAESLGFDAIALTMVGYTPYTKDVVLPDIELLGNILNYVSIPVIAEGNFNTPEVAKEAITKGAYCVVVGSAITRPQWITEKFVEAIGK